MTPRRGGGGFIHGAAIATVCDLDDPMKWGRVRVWFPWLHDEAVSFWARVRASQAGDSRGNFVRPEIGDEVLVMFEMGSMNQPFVVGCLWNGKDAIPGPGNSDGKNDHKWLQTRSGHQLVFNDNDSGGWIEIHDGTQRLHTRFDVPKEWITVRADTGFIHLRAPQGTIRLECQDLNVHTSERCDVQVKNRHAESVGGRRTVTVSEQDVDTRAVERFCLSTPEMTTTAKRLVTTTGQTAARVGEATVSVKPKLDMVFEGEVRRTMVDAKYTVGQFRTTHDGGPSGPLKWAGKKLAVTARGSVRVASGKTLTVIGGTLTGEGGAVTYGKDEGEGQGLGEAKSISFEGGLVALNGGAGPAFPVSKMGDTLMGNCNHTTGPAPPIPAGPIPLFPYMVANPIAKDVVSSVKVNGMAAAPAGATAVGAHIPPIPPPPWLPKPVNYRSSLVGAFNSTFKGPLTAAVAAAKAATKTVEGGESTKSVVTVEGEDAPTAERWHLRTPPLFGSVGAFCGKLSGVPPFPVAVGQLNIACQGVQATDRPLGVTTLMHAHSCSDIVPPPNAMVMGGGNVVAGVSASAMGEAAKWAAEYAGKAYAGGAAIAHRAQRQVNTVKPGSDIVLANETNALVPFPGFVEATAVGHPVDVGSGALFDRVVDFAWPGAARWAWVRMYNSLAVGPAHGGRLGIGWRLGVEEALTRHVPAEGPAFMALHTVDLRAVRLPPVGVGEAAVMPGERLLVERPAKQTWALTDASGESRWFEDDGSGRARLSAVGDASGPVITVTWSAEGWPTLRDRGGVTVALRPVAGGVEAWQPSGDGGRVLARYGFDARGRLGAAAGAGGEARYGYDVDDRLTAETTAGGYRWSFQYDDAGRVSASWGEDGRYAVFLEYAPAAGVTRVRDGLGGVTAWRWDERHRVVGFTAPDGGATVIGRDEHGRIVERVEPGDRLTSFAWDERGRLCERVEPDGARWRWRYDRFGVVEAIDPCGATTRIGRDEAGRVVRVRHPDGREVLRRLDAAGQVVGEDDGGAALAATLDEAGRLVRLRAGDALLRVALDGAGRPARIEGAGAAATLRWDETGRLVERIRGDRTERWQYDAAGALVAFVDADGGRWETRRDALGRAIGQRTPGGERVDSERGLDDRYRWHTRGDGTRFGYRHDALGRLAEHSTDDGGRCRLRRDAAGRLVGLDDRDGRRLTIEPDPVGRPKAVRLRDGGGWMIRRDDRGRPVAASAIRPGRAPIELSLRRDAIGRVVEEGGPHGAVRARYGPGGLRTFGALGVAIEITRAADGAVQAITAPDGAHAFAAADGERIHTLPGGARVVQIGAGWRVEAPGGAVVGRYTATLDPGGRLVEHALVDADGLRWQRRFERDAAGRLRGDFDAGGNRRGAGRVIGAGGRLDADAAGPVEHDRRGRVVAFTEARGECLLEWDAADRLRRVDGSDGVGVEWVYDAFGRPVEQWIRPPGQPARVVGLCWWGDRLVATVEGERAVVHLPLAIDDRAPWASCVDGALWVWLCDARGAVIGAVEGGGRVWWAPAVDAWGAPLDAGAERAPVPGPIPSLAGMWHDPASGLALNRFRWYRAAWGHYLSPDPLGAPGGLRYAFAGQDPASRWDPLGLACADPEAATGAAADTTGGAAPPDAAPAAPAPVTPPVMGPAGPTEQPLAPGTGLPSMPSGLPSMASVPPTLQLALDMAPAPPPGAAPPGLAELHAALRALAGAR
ncbi:MAG: hypothetical protein H6701_03040 [Myxococcales bacterium]|nr:hypothetical protein [Myxococcales bacterium]